jgi:hypothetical protein
MTSRNRSVLIAAAFVITALATTATPAGAASTYCSPSGDLCYGAFAGRPPIKLRVTLAAKYFSRYRLCVTDPAGSRTCRRFSIRAGARGTYGSSVRWSRRFPDSGKGVYRVRWLAGGNALGPEVTFRR